MLLPGSTKDDFCLKCYCEEIGKDYKNITFYLCSRSDFNKSDSDFGGPSGASLSTSRDDPESSDEEFVPTTKRQCKSPMLAHTDPEAKQSQTPEQIILDEELAWEMQKIENESSSEVENVTDIYSVIRKVSSCR
jgi:hypothetical protein